MARSTCLEIMRSAIDWGTSRDRPAWARTAAQIDASHGDYQLAKLEAVRLRVVPAANDGLDAWFEPVHARLADPAGLAQLELSPDLIWRDMVCRREPWFAYEPGNAPLSPLLATVASAVTGHGPLYLSLNLDGWGVAPS